MMSKRLYMSSTCTPCLEQYPTPAFSSPMLKTFGTRPVPLSKASASNVRVSPPISAVTVYVLKGA